MAEGFSIYRVGEPDCQCGSLGFYMFGLARDGVSSERTGKIMKEMRLIGPACDKMAQMY